MDANWVSEPGCQLCVKAWMPTVCQTVRARMPTVCRKLWLNGGNTMALQAKGRGLFPLILTSGYALKIKNNIVLASKLRETKKKNIFSLLSTFERFQIALVIDNKKQLKKGIIVKRITCWDNKMFNDDPTKTANMVGFKGTVSRDFLPFSFGKKALYRHHLNRQKRCHKRFRFHEDIRENVCPQSCWLHCHYVG